MANIALKEKMNTVKSMFNKDSFKKRIAMALPRHMTPERMIGIATSAIHQNPKLLECDPMTLAATITQVSELGLEMGNTLGHAYLVPFWNSKTRTQDVQLIIGYRGLLELARRSGQITCIDVQLVYEKEDFNITYGVENNITHVPLPPSKRGENIIGGYAIARFKDGGYQYVFMYVEDLDKIKNQALDKIKKDYQKYSPWVGHTEEMYKKTIIRRLAKYLPISVEFQKAAVADEYSEQGIKNREYEAFFDEDIIDHEAEVIKEKTDQNAEDLKNELAAKEKALRGK